MVALLSGGRLPPIDCYTTLDIRVSTDGFSCPVHCCFASLVTIVFITSDDFVPLIAFCPLVCCTLLHELVRIFSLFLSAESALLNFNVVILRYPDTALNPQSNENVIRPVVALLESLVTVKSDDPLIADLQMKAATRFFPVLRDNPNAFKVRRGCDASFFCACAVYLEVKLRLSRDWYCFVVLV